MSDLLLRAVETNDLQLLKKKLEEGKLNINGLSGKKELAPLHLAAIKNNVKAAKILIEHGANVRVNDEGNCEPIHYAAAKVCSFFFL
jgi:ankyrin repeat protein